MKRYFTTKSLLAFAALSLGIIAPAQGFAQDEYWHQRYSLFEKLPVTEGDIVFLGNSITDGGEFQELFEMENVLNRGIRSDRIDGVRKRLHQVVDGHPKMIFLLIGINDVADSRNTVKSIAAKYETLVKEIREKTPGTTLFVQSIMPINNDFRRYKSLFGREGLLPPLNEELKQIAMANGAIFIDLWPDMADPATGKMRKELTSDGLHLTGAGYRAWTNTVRPYVDGTINLREDDENANPEEAHSAEEQSLIIIHDKN